jgi:hypothetical protein
MKLAAYEQPLKWLALALGLCSTISIVQNWQLAERQLKYINMVFSALYIYGIARYLITGA